MPKLLPSVRFDEFSGLSLSTVRVMRPAIRRIAPTALLLGAAISIQPSLATAVDLGVSMVNGRLSVLVATDSNLILACSAAGQVTLNGVTTSPIVACADVTEIVAKVRTDATPVRNTVDLRGVTQAAFPMLSLTYMISQTGKDTFFGTEISDRIYGVGSISAGGGDDVIIATSAAVSSVLRGGTGNDNIYGSDGTSDTLKGGPRNDYLFPGRSGTDVALGGDGDDVLMITGSNSRFEGGNGDDKFSIWELSQKPFFATPVGNGAAIYGGSGTDTLWNSTDTGCSGAVAPGGIASQFVLSCTTGWTIVVSVDGVESNLFLN
jgi:hypothetical protein